MNDLNIKKTNKSTIFNTNNFKRFFRIPIMMKRYQICSRINEMFEIVQKGIYWFGGGFVDPHARTSLSAVGTINDGIKIVPGLA